MASTRRCGGNRRPIPDRPTAAAGCMAYPGEFPATLEEAYRSRTRRSRRWARPVIGWKVGRVVPPHGDRFGTDRLAGPIFSVAARWHGGELGGDAGIRRRFRRRRSRISVADRRSPAAGKRDFTLDEAAALIDAVHVGIEIASSPLARHQRARSGRGRLRFRQQQRPAGRRAGVRDWRDERIRGLGGRDLIDGVEVGQRASPPPSPTARSARPVSCSS